MKTEFDIHLRACGPVYGTLLVIAGLTSFLLTWALIKRGRGPTLAPALFFAVSLPAVVGALGFVDGLMRMLGLIVDARGEWVRLSLIYVGGLGTAFIVMILGLALCVPSGLLAIWVGFIRSCPKDRSRAGNDLSKGATNA